MSAAADIECIGVDGWTVAHLKGELDMTNCTYVREEVTRAIPNEGRGLIADLSRTLYLDSAAIEMLFEMARRLGRRRQRLRVVLPAASPLRRVLDLTDVDALAPVHETLDEALAIARAEE